MNKNGDDSMAMITEIEVKNFRGIREAEIKDLGQVNIFIGRNGAGKSTILEAIYLASAWCNGEIKLLEKVNNIPKNKINYIIYRRGRRGNWKEMRDYLWFQTQTYEPIEISLLFKFSDKKVKLLYTLFNRDDNGTVWLDTDKSKFLENSDRFSLATTLRELIGDVMENKPLFSYTRKAFSDHSLNVTLAVESPELTKLTDRILGYLNTKLKDVIEYLKQIIFIDDLIIGYTSVFERILWKKILGIRADKILIKMLNNGLEKGVEGLTYMPIDDEYVLMVLFRNTSVKIDDLGAGSRDALLRIMPLLVLRNTAILLEEPETHLHPGGLYVFLKYLLEIARKNNLQLFISTHSIELTDFTLRISEEEKIDSRVFFLERDENGKVSYRILKKLDVDVLRKLGIDPRFLDII